MDQVKPLQITLQQADPDQLATIKRIFEEELGTPLSETTQQSPTEEKTKAIDWLAVSAVVLAVPGAALAAKDLASRLSKKKQMDKALDRVCKEVKTTTNRITFTYPDGTMKTVEHVTTTEIIDQYDESHP